LDNFLIVLGNILWMTREASGWMRFALTTTSCPLIYEDVLSIGTNLIHNYTSVTFSVKLAFFCEKNAYFHEIHDFS